MPRPLAFPLAIILLLPVSSNPAAASPPSMSDPEEFYAMVRNVTDILAGKDEPRILDAVAPGARLVLDDREESLRDAIMKKNNSYRLADTSYHGMAVTLKSDRDENAAFIILRTETADRRQIRYHSVVVMRDSSARLRIESWHAGD